MAVTGSVTLVGAGPGDPGLLTRRAIARLRAADLVLYDALVDQRILRYARHAQRFFVGKRAGRHAITQAGIHAVMIRAARRGRRVVRLKGGDPFVFGRGSEEVAACRAASVPVFVVPGVSSAVAGPAAAGIPVTARGVARSFAVVTAQGADGLTDIRTLSGVDTLVVMMGRSALPAVAAQLIAAGRDPSTPAACIQSATTPEQRVTRATLETIAAAADRDGLESPVVTVIGAVAGLADAASLLDVPTTLALAVGG